MANEQTRQPRNIFEMINQNVVDLSNDVVAIYEKWMQSTRYCIRKYLSLTLPAQKRTSNRGY